MDQARSVPEVPIKVPRRRDATAPCAASATPTGAHDARSLLALQRAAGNRAVGALLARQRAPVQRSFKRWKPKEGAPLHVGFTNVDAKAKQIDAAVDTAYGLVVAMLKSQKAVKLPGVSDNRYASWIQTVTNPFSGDNARAASTGYIIEDNATFGFRGDPMVSLQDTSLEGTRPDAVITDRTNFFSGYLDITSAPEAGHVFDKKGNWGLKPYVVESLYPKIDFADPSKSPMKLSEEDMALVDKWREDRASRAIVKAHAAFESRKRRFNAERRPLIRDLMMKSAEFRMKVGGAPSGGRGPNRVITAYQEKVKKYGIKISPDTGEMTVLKFQQLVKKSYLYKPEQIRKLYGL